MQPGSIGRFAVRRRLGAGGFASVWLAHDPELDAPVAVKVLADNWAGQEDVRRRFVDEARLLRRVDSDHVVRVYDIGTTEAGQPYFVMTFADGGCLEERLEQAPAPWPAAQVVGLVEAVTAGLEVLHAHGIVHRDVKPRNILLRRRTAPGGGEQVLLGDLGVAKDLTWASGLTMPVGTAGYHPPEQGGFSADVGPASDVYALAMVAARLLGLTGPPWPPGPLQPVLAAATEPDPARRTASAARFAADLRHALTPAAPSAPSAPAAPADPADDATAGAAGRATPPRRRPVLRRAAVALALVAVAAAGSAAWFATQRDTTFRAGRVSLTLPPGWTSTGAVQVPGESTGSGLTVVADGGRRISAAIATTDAGPAAVAGRTVHAECTRAEAATVTAGRLRGTAFRWSGCPGGGTVDEVGLAAADAASEVVWVRVVSVGGEPGLEEALGRLGVRD